MGAWPRLEIDPGHPGPTEFRSPGLEAVAGRLREDRKQHILDLGPACGPNVGFFSRVPCKIYVEDLYHGLARLPPRGEDDPPRSPSDLEPFLTHDRRVRFDIILGWDLLDYLERDVIGALVAHLREFSRRGTMLFILTSVRDHIPAEPGRFIITGEDNRLLYEPYLPPTRKNPQYTPLAFERMMVGFHLLHSFMLTNGMQEYVFSSG